MRSQESLNKEIANQTRVLIHKKLKMSNQNQVKPIALRRRIPSIPPHKHTDYLGSTQYQITVKIEILGSHRRRTAVVALDTTDSDNAVRTLRDGIGQQKLELQDLVPAQLHTR